MKTMLRSARDAAAAKNAATARIRIAIAMLALVVVFLTIASSATFPLAFLLR